MLQMLVFKVPALPGDLMALDLEMAALYCLDNRLFSLSRERERESNSVSTLVAWRFIKYGFQRPLYRSNLN